MGCDYKTDDTEICDIDGDCFRLGEIRNPETGGFAAVIDIADDQLIPATEVDEWERRLRIKIPRPPINP